jgi:hypothetical protein
MYPKFDVADNNADESKCFIDTQGKIYCNGTTYFDVRETVACPERMCQVERKVECHGQDRCQITQDRLSISKNDQLFDRFVNEKATWK